jgi:hypothetical protein
MNSLGARTRIPKTIAFLGAFSHSQKDLLGIAFLGADWGVKVPLPLPNIVLVMVMGDCLHRPNRNDYAISCIALHTFLRLFLATMNYITVARVKVICL